MNILGIETSCDETAAAVVKDGREVLSNVVYTQIPLHQPYGGVVPEIASRAHVEKIGQVVGEALESFKVAVGSNSVAARTNSVAAGTNKVAVGSETLNDAKDPKDSIDAVAVTYGPGLSPALLVGLNAAKGLAKALGVPLIGINHIEAHLHSPFLYDVEDKHRDTETQSESERLSVPPCLCVKNPTELTPALGLAISGGNTMWVDMPEYGKYEVIGETLDDAAGEAFDKAAKLLGLGYPGGLKIDKMASAWMAETRLEDGGRRSDNGSSDHHCSTFNLQPSTSFIPFPKGRPREGVTALAGLPAELCVSFSGLKTALLRYVQKEKPTEADLPRVVASYQEAIVQAVADRTRTALKRKSYKSFILGGGVSLNSRIRAVLSDVARDAGVPLLMAKPKYTGDNGAMIAGLAYYRRNHVEDAMSLDANPCLEVGG